MTEHWTSTQFHHWKRDCEGFAVGNQLFEVIDIFTPEQELFYVGLCETHGYACVRKKYNVICTPPAVMKEKQGM
ncbi:hypothetical protein [Pedosphaera parvula]|uniref:Uncharacterized protein n=1 Tax=Pedosphaera parvula (strain Ellin514) TaxID=320771 RepID=B9XDC7_PEDPL|nr:hypothetical protein [Pedosphaera parvula]EEF62073.1 hypothetical protein Cflav_PD6348 [Pedosphaera parvula Ellin514]